MFDIGLVRCAVWKQPAAVIKRSMNRHDESRGLELHQRRCLCERHPRSPRAGEDVLLKPIRDGFLDPEHAERMVEEMEAYYAERLRQQAARAADRLWELRELEARLAGCVSAWSAGSVGWRGKSWRCWAGSGGPIWTSSSRDFIDISLRGLRRPPLIGMGAHNVYGAHPAPREVGRMRADSRCAAA